MQGFFFLCPFLLVVTFEVCILLVSSPGMTNIVRSTPKVSQGTGRKHFLVSQGNGKKQYLVEVEDTEVKSTDADNEKESGRDYEDYGEIPKQSKDSKDIYDLSWISLIPDTGIPVRTFIN